MAPVTLVQFMSFPECLLTSLPFGMSYAKSGVTSPTVRRRGPFSFYVCEEGWCGIVRHVKTKKQPLKLCLRATSSEKSLLIPAAGRPFPAGAWEPRLLLRVASH